MSSHTYGTSQLPPFFDSFLKHRLLTRTEERNLAFLTKCGTASYPVRFTIRNQTDQTRNCRTGVRTFRTALTRFALGISRPSMGEHVHGVVHFSVKSFGDLPEFKPHGIAIAIYEYYKRAPSAIIPCRFDTRWGWYARWNSKSVENGYYRAVVHIPDSLALRATHALMSLNYRFVLKTARKYLWSGVPLEDLFDAGVAGLQRGIDKYDPRSGNRLNTYVVWWIRQALTYSCRHLSRTIRVPPNQWERHYHIRKAMDYYERRGLKVDFKAIAREVSEKTRRDVTVEKVQETLEVFAGDVLPLDIPSERDQSFSVLDFTATEEPDARDVLTAQYERDALYAALSMLSSREKRIMEMRFGIGNDEDHTLGAIGKIYGITRERVRQIEKACLKKMHRSMK